MTPAARLRDAARVLRERAEAASLPTMPDGPGAHGHPANAPEAAKNRAQGHSSGESQRCDLREDEL